MVIDLLIDIGCIVGGISFFLNFNVSLSNKTLINQAIIIFLQAIAFVAIMTGLLGAIHSLQAINDQEKALAACKARLEDI